jgi:hypothetical protein
VCNEVLPLGTVGQRRVITNIRSVDDICEQRLATSTRYGSDSSLNPVTSDCPPRTPRSFLNCNALSRRLNWMSESSTSTLHRGGVRDLERRVSLLPMGPNWGEHSTVRAELPFAGSTLRPRANVTTALPPWRPSVSKEIQLQRGGVSVKGRDSI